MVNKSQTFGIVKQGVVRAMTAEEIELYSMLDEQSDEFGQFVASQRNANLLILEHARNRWPDCCPCFLN